MTFTEAAAEVLRIAGKPLHYKEITELAIEQNLLSHVGKSPEVTMGARLAALLKKEDKENPIVRVKPGVFALREWDGKKKKRGASVDEAPAESEESAAVEVNALELEAAARGAAPDAGDDEDDEPIEVSGEDALRADLAASGAEMFDDEDDDDQPILSSPSSAEATRAQDARAGVAGGEDGGRRRRRRRRRRGGRGEGEGDRASGPRVEVISPTAIVSVDVDSSIDTSRDPLAPAPRPMIRDRHQIMAGGAPTGIDLPAGEQEELSGRELADATVMILSSFDRTQGPVQVRSVVDALLRRGRLAGDTMMASAQLTASLRADNLRRNANGQRPRFRFAGAGGRQDGARIALTDWTLSSDLVRLELDAISAIERYREAARRTMLRKLQELPGHALIELVLLGLERVGMTNVRTIRRAGAPGGEAHFAALHRNGTDEIRTAIVVRKDGREVGRERVSDLRGALHHYGPASAGWLITTGQVLSGAREEAGAPAAPIALFDGVSLCRLLEENDVGVIRTHLTTAIPDLELYETLRGG
ncbi:MAG: restriction endonuclease [Labilithrix sp.]|nr:restriction endonuclease [Labilithrix sp.]MBX3222829.1 restriction endonuclease [Labilithrix sp.]